MTARLWRIHVVLYLNVTQKLLFVLDVRHGFDRVRAVAFWATLMIDRRMHVLGRVFITVSLLCVGLVALLWVRVLIIQLLRICVFRLIVGHIVGGGILLHLVSLLRLHRLRSSSRLCRLLRLMEFREVKKRDVHICWWHGPLSILNSTLLKVWLQTSSSLCWLIHSVSLYGSWQIVIRSAVIKSHWVLIRHHTQRCRSILLTVSELIECSIWILLLLVLDIWRQLKWLGDILVFLGVVSDFDSDFTTDKIVYFGDAWLDGLHLALFWWIARVLAALMVALSMVLFLIFGFGSSIFCGLFLPQVLLVRFDFAQI